MIYRDKFDRQPRIPTTRPDSTGLPTDYPFHRASITAAYKSDPIRLHTQFTQYRDRQNPFARHVILSLCTSAAKPKHSRSTGWQTGRLPTNPRFSMLLSLSTSLSSYSLIG